MDKSQKTVVAFKLKQVLILSVVALLVSIVIALVFERGFLLTSILLFVFTLEEFLPKKLYQLQMDSEEISFYYLEFLKKKKSTWRINELSFEFHSEVLFRGGRVDSIIIKSLHNNDLFFKIEKRYFKKPEQFSDLLNVFAPKD